MFDAKNINSSYIAPQLLYMQNMRLRRNFYIEWYKNVLYSPIIQDVKINSQLVQLMNHQYTTEQNSEILLKVAPSLILEHLGTDH